MLNRTKIHNNIHFIFLMIIVLLLPISMKATNIFIVLLTANFLIEGNFKSKKEIYKKDKYLWLFIFYYITVLIGVLYSGDVYENVKRLEVTLPILIFPLLFSVHTHNKETISKLLHVFVLGILILCFICTFSLGYNYTVNFIHRNNYNFIIRSLFDFTTIHPTYFSMYLVFAMFIIFESKLLSDFFKLLLSAFFFTFLLLLATRISLIAFFFLLIFRVFFLKGIKVKWRDVLMAFFVGIGILTLTLNISFTRDKIFDTLAYFDLVSENEISDKGKGYHSSNRRIVIWTSAVEIIQENLLFGLGTGNSQEALINKYKQKEFPYFQFNAHNQYLQTTLEQGLFGLLALLISFFTAIFLAFKKKNHLYIIFCILFIICCITESLLLRQKGVVFFALFNALFAFSNQENSLKG